MPAQIYSNDELERFNAEMEGHHGAKKTKSNRVSSKNELRVRFGSKFGSKYRDPANTRELMGELQSMAHGERH